MLKYIYDTQVSFKENNQLLLFDLAVAGHHAEYIRHIIGYWIEEKVDSNLNILVTPKFIEIHTDISCLVKHSKEQKIKLFTISSDEEYGLELQKNILARAFFEWNLFCNYADQLKVDQGVLMYFDYFQLPLVFGKRSPCKVAGIYFRPTLHYKFLDSYHFSWKEYFRDLRKKIILRFALRQSQLKTLFCLDVFAIEYIQKLTKNTNVVYLPDPIAPHKCDLSQVEVLRNKLNIRNEKKILLLFGSLDERKGIYQVLEATTKLEENVARKICLLFVGKITSSEREQFQRSVTRISQLSKVDIHIQDEFVPDKDVKLYFELADIVLIPYQGHVGMSGILLHATAARKKLIASDYGLLGALVKQYYLGITVNSTSSTAIADSITLCLNTTEINNNHLASNREFIHQHSIYNFQYTLFKNLI